jgi:hypothetical protein
MKKAMFWSEASEPRRLVGSVELREDGTLVASGPTWLHRAIARPAGLLRLIEPTEGESYLEALALQYSGSMLRVELVSE